MKRLWLLLSFFVVSFTLAGTGDFVPSRSGITYNSHPYGLNSIEFNRYTDSVPLSYFAGDCPSPTYICNRAQGTPGCPYAVFLAELTPSERTDCFRPRDADERDFLKAGIVGSNQSGWPYDNNLPQQQRNLVEGDIVRFLIYAHNNGTEGKSYLTARNTKITLDWSNPLKPKASIFASNAQPNTINDFATLGYADPDLKIEPRGLAFYLDHNRPNAGGIVINPSSSTETSQTFTYGDLPSSYGFYRILYVDFNVVKGNRDATIVKDSVPPSGTVVPRESIIDYTLTITNTGSLPISNAVVTDVLDSNLEFVSIEPNTRYVGTESGGVLTYNINGAFAAGETIDLQFKARVKSTTPAGVPILNKGTLNGDGITMKMSNIVEHSVEDLFPETDKEGYDANFTAPLMMSAVGETYGYEISVINPHNQDITGDFVITDRLPAELTFNSFATHVSDAGNTYSITDIHPDAGDPRNIRFTFSNLKANDILRLRFLVDVNAVPTAGQTDSTNGCPDPTKLNNIAKVVINETGTTNQIFEEDLCDVVMVQEPEVQIEKKALDDNLNPLTHVSVGDWIVYELIATNTSSVNINENVIIRDVLPFETDFVEFVSGSYDLPTGVTVVSETQTTETINSETRSIATITLSNLPAGQSAKLYVKATPTVEPAADSNPGVNPVKCPEGNINNDVFIRLASTPTGTYVDQDCATLTTIGPRIDKETYDKDFTTLITTADVGDIIGYEIQVINDEPIDINGTFVVTDFLPPEVDFVEFRPYVSTQGNTYAITEEHPADGDQKKARWTFNDLKASDTLKLRFTVEVLATPTKSPTTTKCPDPMMINNVAQLVVTVNSGTTVIFEDDDCDPVDVRKNPRFEKETYDEGFTNLISNTAVGEKLGYELQVINDHDEAIRGDFAITDLLPDDVTFIEFRPYVSDLSNTYNITNTYPADGDPQKARFTFRDLQPLDTLRLRLIVEVQSAPVNGQVHPECPNPELINNIADIRVTDPIIPTTVYYEDEDCDPVAVPPSIAFDKKALTLDGTEIPDNTFLQFGQEFLYELTVTNTSSSTPLTNLVVSDDLPPEVIFIEQVDPTNGVYDATNHSLEWNFTPLAPLASEVFTFKVQVKPEDQSLYGGTVINNASADSAETDPLFDNTTHKLPTKDCTDCGGGSGPRDPSVGQCFIHPNGALSCRRIRPHKGDPDYQAYLDCVKDTNDKDACVDAWAVARGFRQCDPNANSLTTPSIRDYCDKPIIPGNPGCVVNPTADILKQVQDKDSAGNPFWTDQTCVTSGDMAKYRISVLLPRADVNIGGFNRPTQIKVSDFTIPYTSGWTWNRSGIHNAKVIRFDGSTQNISADNVIGIDGKPTGGMQFVYNLTPAEEIQWLSGGLEVKFEYDVDTTLAATSDICQLDNIAVATVDYDARAGDGSAIPGIYGIGEKSCTGIGPGDVATYGDKARLCIARPFIQAKGGSNIGVNLSSDKDKVFGSDFLSELEGVNQSVLIPSLQPANLNEAGSSSELLVNNNASSYGGSIVNFDGIDSFAATDRDSFIDQLKLNATPSTSPDPAFRESAGATWTKSQTSDTYFVDGNLSIGGSLGITQAMTIVVDGNLTVDSNFTINNSGFVAFIVRNGNIGIQKNVASLDGIFISDGGTITSLGGESETQLQISGGIMGQARDLLENRTFIGLDPATKLEPAVLVRFDLRLLDNTPPGIDLFLGDGWKETAQ